jgi:hypothetical protein
MQQEFLMMADGADSTNGKIYVLGGGADRHLIQRGANRPIQVRADIAFGILVDWTETNNSHTFALKLDDEDGTNHITIEGQFEAGRPPGSKPGQQMRNLIAVRGPFPVPDIGAYKWVLALDGTDQEPPFRFWIDEFDGPVPGQAR